MQERMDQLKQRYATSPLKWLTIAGFVVVILALFGPWERAAGIISEEHANGFEFGGAIILLLALGGLGGIGAYAFGNINLTLPTLNWAVLVIVVAIDLLVLRATLDIFSDIDQANEILPDTVKIGWGLLVAWLGGLLSTIGGVVPFLWSLFKARGVRSPAAPPGSEPRTDA